VNIFITVLALMKRQILLVGDLAGLKLIEKKYRHQEAMQGL